MRKLTDTERLDFIQELTDGYGLGWILRRSTSGRGWRLHETSKVGAVNDVRKAIDLAYLAINIEREDNG